MPAANTDKLKKYKSLFSTTLSTGIGTGTGDTITPASVSGLPTDTAITLTFDRVDSGGVATPTKLERIVGVISGGNFTSYVRGVDGTTEQAHTAGAVIEMIWNADDWNDAVDWGLAQHNQDGTHKSATVTTLKATGAEITTGTEDAKIVTPKAIADSNIPTAKATGAEIDTGTDDDKFVTPKAIEDSSYAKTSAIPVKASGAEITTGTDDAKFLTAKALADATVGKIGAAWSTYTCTTNGIVVGNGTLTTRYMQTGKKIDLIINFVLGSTSAINNYLSFSLPVASAQTYVPASGYLQDTGTALYLAMPYISSGALYCPVPNVASTYPSQTNVSATIPFTWANTDVIFVSCTYEIS